MKISQAEWARKPIVNKSIRPYNSLKHWLAPKPEPNHKSVITALYGPHKAFVQTSVLLITQRYACVHPRILERWHKRTEPLWWSCASHFIFGGDKRTLRSWNARRGRMAFTKALEQKGFGPDGRRLRSCPRVRRAHPLSAPVRDCDLWTPS